KRDALRNIADHLTAMMRRHDPPLVSWQPTQEFIMRYVVRGEGQAGPDETNVEQVGTVRTWIYPIRDVDLVGLDAEAGRRQRRFERIELSLPWLGAYLLALAGLATCFRAVSFWRRLR